MKKKETFCELCRDDVEYSIISKKMSGEIKGETYDFIGEVAYCDVCGSELYVSEIMDQNLSNLNDVYRNEKDIVSLETIRKLPELYSIGKRPLSKLLGWGEMTFSRYVDGDIPTKQYSEILQKMYDDPHYYLELLDKNKDRLDSEKTYRKTLDKVNELIGVERNSKIEIVVNYLINECGDITPLALQKALYYIQGFYYAFENEFLFDVDCQAWVHGPVYVKTYYHYATYRFNPIDPIESFDFSSLSSVEKTIIDSVIHNFCCYSGKTLEKFTHYETPWLVARDGLPVNEKSNRVIYKETIASYFSAVKEKYEMINPADIISYSTTLFEQLK